MECLQLMVEGDRWKVHIPSKLAYGGAGSPPQIPSHAVLVFDMELLEVGDGEKGGKSQQEAMNMFATALDKLSSPPPPPPLSPSSSSSSSSPSLSYDSFTFEYRQTKVALAMIVSVSNIVPSSVKIKFNTKGCDVCFEDSNEKLYGMGKC